MKIDAKKEMSAMSPKQNCTLCSLNAAAVIGSTEVAFIIRLFLTSGANASSESPKAKTLRPDKTSSFNIYWPTNPVAPVIRQTFTAIGFLLIRQ